MTLTPMLEEYFTALENQRKELGDSSVLLLMQVGSFYEAYEIDEPRPRGCAKIVSDILRIHLTKKNGNKPDAENNPWMVGFPTYVLGKHLGRLNDEGYTVAVYDQRIVEHNKVERYLKGVYDYVMRHEGGPDEEAASVTDPIARDRRLFGVTIEKYKDSFQRRNRVDVFRYIISIAFVDMGTGTVGVSEQEGESYERELQDMMLHHAPPEVILRCEGALIGEEEAARMEDILRKTGIAGKIHSRNGTEEERNCSATQKLEILSDVYETRKDEDPLVVLGLERYASIANTLTMLLDYVRKHDPVLATKLRKPVFMDGEGGTTMRYNRDAFLELNIASVCERRRGSVESRKQKSLLDMLSQGMNPLGRRRLEAMLRRPITDEEEIKRRQSSIAYFQEAADKNSNSTEDGHLPDLEWMLLRWRRERLSFRLVGQLLQSLILVCTKTCDRYPEFWSDDRETWERFHVEVTTRFDVEKMMNNDLDFIQCTSVEQEEFLSRQTVLKKEIMAIEEEYKENFRMQQSADGSYFLGCSVKKWETYQYRNPKNALYEISKNKSQVRVSLEALDKSSTRMQALMNERESYVLASFRSLSRELLEKHEMSLTCIVQKIADMDCWIHLAAFFKKYHYVQPKLLSSSSSSSARIAVTDLRHALLEYLHRDQMFVPYSFSLGDGSDDEPLGMLLYGMNSSGKSTILKSLGIAVWLAQCGLYVAAGDMEWTIRRSVYTKIGAYDNLFCNHSTFVAEMSELNYMLRRASEDSLILCDELTSGTETSSATGIVASCLLELVSRKMLFLFTTHLHTLQKIPEIRDNSKIRTCHFRVRCADDAEVKEVSSASLLIEDIRVRYDRELREGSGEDLYGIEIARTLGMPESFIKNAFAFRHRVEIFVHEAGEGNGVSKYNSRVIMRCCEKCGSKIHLHAHHITPQKQFHKDSGIIHEKNGAYNLVVLCERCHQAVHASSFFTPAETDVASASASGVGGQTKPSSFAVVSVE
uniref:DNA mismatch repair proteins mutS family domain-containing protein n=1 Tax=viral metagenome TaxID=1070528 RepID=A0A6C0K5R3_9ZZZZ